MVRAGYDVVGMMMRLWTDDALGGAEHNRCCTPEQMSDARRIADKLGIPFYVLDSKDIFRSTVVQYFIDQHRDGYTPNPCLECNRHIRFDWLLNNALALDADYLAHRSLRAHFREFDRRLGLAARAGRGRKIRAMSSASWSNRSWRAPSFPVGEYHKHEVRELAEELGLNAAGKKDSQDLCFLGRQRLSRFPAFARA